MLRGILFAKGCCAAAFLREKIPALAGRKNQIPSGNNYHSAAGPFGGRIGRTLPLYQRINRIAFCTGPLPRPAAGEPVRK